MKSKYLLIKFFFTFIFINICNFIYRISIDKRSEKRNDFMNLLKKAAGEDEDEDDIFVILDTIIM